MTGAVRSLVLLAVVATAALAPTGVGGAAAADAGLTIDHEGETVTVANASSQVVSGTADLRAGSELTVRVRSTGDTQPRFIKAAGAVVTENGTWGVAFDFSAQSPEDSFLVTVSTENGSARTERDGAVVACEGNCTETPPQDTPTPIPEQTQQRTTDGERAAVAFDGHTVAAERGGVAALALTYRATERATVVVGNESESGYELVATVVDADGDGGAVVYVDTALAGRSGRTVSTSGGDEVRVDSETSLNTSLDAGDYTLALYGDGTTDRQPASLGTLLLQEVDTTTATPAQARPAAGGAGPLGVGATGLALSAALILGGAGLAVVLLRQ
jgi:hypothetical protein